MPVNNIHVKCDKCDWRLTLDNFEQIKEWHNKKCPKCNDCVIVNDLELKACDGIINIVKLLKKSGLQEANVSNKKSKGIKINIKFDSADMRIK